MTDVLKLKRRLPEGRTFEQIRNHYEVERAFALKIKNSTREERKAFYPYLYEELFQKVPDHPRCREREDIEKIRALNHRKFQIVRNFLSESSVFVEFASGDCHFASYVARHVMSVYAIDISDQRSPSFQAPANFRLILYDGYNLDWKENFADVVFSDQLIEHLHPEDVESHFAMVRRILCDGGVYVFRTPHAYSGPHDISKYFSDVPEGFHLKEWTFSEITRVLKKMNYSDWQGWMRMNNTYKSIPSGYFQFFEAIIKNLPRKPRRFISRLFLPLKMTVSAIK